MEILNFFFFRTWEQWFYTWLIFTAQWKNKIEVSAKTKSYWLWTSSNPAWCSLLNTEIILGSWWSLLPWTQTGYLVSQMILQAILKHLALNFCTAANVLLFKRSLASSPYGKLAQKRFGNILLHWGSVKMCLMRAEFWSSQKQISY